MARWKNLGSLFLGCFKMETLGDLDRGKLIAFIVIGIETTCEVPFNKLIQFRCKDKYTYILFKFTLVPESECSSLKILF